MELLLAEFHEKYPQTMSSGMQVSRPQTEFGYIFGRFKMLEHFNRAYVEFDPQQVEPD